MIRTLVAISIGILFSCSTDPVPVDCSAGNLMLELNLVEPAPGCGIAGGKIVIQASGGRSPYQYASVNHPFQSSGEFNELAPGIYSFVVRDKNNCESTLNNITLMASDISFSATIVDNTSCVGGNGSITIAMSGGTPPFQYKIGTEEFSGNNTFTNLPSSNYLITVKDAADCITDFSINVGQGLTNTSWSTEILPIITTSCATNGCHNGVARTDLRIYANAKQYAALIKTYTQNGYMPFTGTITPAEKAKIACWVEEGALEN